MTRLATLARHPLAIAGVVIATVAGVLFVILAAAEVAGLFSNPYAGLVIFIALPALLILGLLLIPAGIWLENRRPDGPREEWPVLDFRVGRVRRMALFIAVLTAVNVTIIALAAYGGLHAMESPTFCGATCHTAMQPQYVAWQHGPHAGVPCVQCHIGEGPKAFVHAKLAGVRQLVHVFTNAVPTPIPPGAQMPPGEQAKTCLGCHRSGQQGVGRQAPDRLRVIREYADDEANAETMTTLQMRVAAIHWHADPKNRVAYVATDAARGTIPYVKVTSGDQSREFTTPDAKTVDQSAARMMDCVDCHNTVGHPFAATPEIGVDRAIAAGAIDRQLPNVRREGVTLLKADYRDETAARASIERQLREFYQSLGRPVDERALQRSIAGLQAVYGRNVFPAMKVTFGSYPDQRGHLTATGCFRCHDGSHTDASGKEIPSDCETCHKDVTPSITTSPHEEREASKDTK